MASEQYRREYAQHLVEMVNKGKMTRRQLLIRASVFGFSATVASQLLAACGGSSSGGETTSASPTASAGPEPVMGGTLKVIISPSITDIDPVTIYDQGGITLISQFCEYLINLKDDMSLEGRLAESWSPNDTGDVWTFKLRQGIKFNDGSPFEAPDVVSTMDRLVDPKSGSAAQAALLGILSVGGTKAVDQYTVDFNLDKPFADFPYMVCTSSYNTVMLPRNYKGDWVKNPVGTGPWLLKEYVAKQKCTATKKPDYWRKDAEGRQLPFMDEIDWVMIADESASTLQLQSGTADVQAQTVFQGAQALWTDPNLRVDIYPSPGIRELQMNTLKDPFTDKRVRQAVALSLDREAINQALFDGKSIIGNDTFFQTPPYPNQPPTSRAHAGPREGQAAPRGCRIPRRAQGHTDRRGLPRGPAVRAAHPGAVQAGRHRRQDRPDPLRAVVRGRQRRHALAQRAFRHHRVGPAPDPRRVRAGHAPA